MVFAIQKEHERIAKKLIEKGANLAVATDEGDTIMHIVCRKQFAKLSKQKSLIRLLVSKGCSNSAKNKEGKAASEYLINEELKQML